MYAPKKNQEVSDAANAPLKIAHVKGERYSYPLRANAKTVTDHYTLFTTIWRPTASNIR